MAGTMATNDQSQQRRYERKRDQHGRLWGMSVELKNGAPTGRIEFIAHIKHPSWNPKPEFIEPPILPPQQFIRPVPGDPHALHIDYDRWAEQLGAAEADYNRRAMEEGIRVHGSEYDAEAPMSREVALIMGPRPMARALAIACKQGNPWLIGKTRQTDARLAPLVPKRRSREIRMENEEDYSKLVTSLPKKESKTDTKDAKAGAGAGGEK